MDTTLNILENLPKIFNKDESSNNHGFIKSFADSYDLATIQEQLLSEQLFIDTCTGTNLDRKGALYGIARGILSDADYRNLIKSRTAYAVGGGIVQSIKDAVKGVVDCSDSDITVTSVSAATFSVNVAVNETYSITVLSRAFFDEIKAAGTWLEELTLTTQSSIWMMNISFMNSADTLL